MVQAGAVNAANPIICSYKIVDLRTQDLLLMVRKVPATTHEHCKSVCLLLRYQVPSDLKNAQSNSFQSVCILSLVLIFILIITEVISQVPPSGIING